MAPHNFRTGNGSIPRRLRVELVFNSESFVREAIFLGQRGGERNCVDDESSSSSSSKRTNESLNKNGLHAKFNPLSEFVLKFLFIRINKQLYTLNSNGRAYNLIKKKWNNTYQIIVELHLISQKMSLILLLNNEITFIYLENDITRK